MAKTNTRKAVFLDRDGTIIVEKGFIGNPNDVELLDGSAEAIKLLLDEKFAVVCVSNQSGVARGLFDESAVKSVNEKMSELLAKKGAYLDGIYYCPHLPPGVEPNINNEYIINCTCRKPNPGMVHKAIIELGVVPAYVVGDRKSDLELAEKLSIPGILVLTGYGSNQPEDVKNSANFVAQNLLDAVQWILQNEKKKLN